MSPGFLSAERQPRVVSEGALLAAVGRYQPECLLARTAFSQVFVARHLETGQRVALKLLPPFEAEPESVRKFFFREIRALQMLVHPNVVVIHDSGETTAGAYIVTELLRGHNLGDWLAQSAATPYSGRLAVARQVALGLEAVHAAGLVHGDIKPGNVFVETSGNVKLLDFATARRHESLIGSLGPVAGTPAYAAPEAVRGGGLGPRADMFAFGVLCFELIAGANPFRRASLDETLRAVVTATLPVAAIREAGASRAVVAILEACLGKEASLRPASFSEIVRALDE